MQIMVQINEYINAVQQNVEQICEEILFLQFRGNDKNSYV